MRRARSDSPKRPAVVALAAAAAFCLLLVAVAARWRPLIRFDRAVVRRVVRVDGHHTVLVDVARAVSAIGQPLVWEVAAGALVLVELLRSRTRSAAVVLGALVADLVVGHVLKVAVGRARPTVPHPVAHAAGASFPSSHALAATVVLSVALLVVGRAALPRTAWRWSAAAAVLVAIVIGLSRVVLAVHYPSDVVGGWLLGSAICFGAAALAGPDTSPAPTGAGTGGARVRARRDRQL